MKALPLFFEFFFPVFLLFPVLFLFFLPLLFLEIFAHIRSDEV